jgi:hypothetical protein
MKKQLRVFLLTIGVLFLIASSCIAHVPYFERKDLSEEQPFDVPHTIEQSIAIYAWLENDGLNPSVDIDAYRFEATLCLVAKGIHSMSPLVASRIIKGLSLMRR